MAHAAAWVGLQKFGKLPTQMFHIFPDSLSCRVLPVLPWFLRSPRESPAGATGGRCRLSSLCLQKMQLMRLQTRRLAVSANRTFQIVAPSGETAVASADTTSTASFDILMAWHGEGGHGNKGRPMTRPGHAVTRPGHAITRTGHAMERPGHALAKYSNSFGICD